MSTDNANAKRSANDAGSVPEDGRGGKSSPAAKRLKTDMTATDPVSGFVLNPDIIMKALLYVDISEVSIL